MGVKVTVEAPSNIALIKYMGKSNLQVNEPANPSLSYTLPNLKTKVSIEEIENMEVSWSSEETSNYSISLNEEGKNKFLSHWRRCHQRLAPSYQNGVKISSGNNFPSDCGLASSASSFAALTLASHQFFLELGMLEKTWTREELALLSREGSGSSCRSFFEPWVLWSGSNIQQVQEVVWGNELLHAAIVVDNGKKKISSSEAHRRIVKSSMFEGRVERATMRCEQLQKLLKMKDSWSSIYELVWSEFWDMHLLFETSSPPFYYLSPKSLLALRYLQEDWGEKGDGPLITMDAGPNIHLLYRKNQAELMRAQLEKLNKMDYMVISDQRW